MARRRPNILGTPIPIAGIAGDQQAATFGQACFQPGAAKNTYGTGCFLLLNTGEQPVMSQNNLLTTVGWHLDGKITYCLEGSVFVAGAVVQWLRDGLGLIPKSADVEQLAASVPDSGGVVFVPAFVGLGAPYWDPYARGRCSASRAAPRPATWPAPRSNRWPCRPSICWMRCDKTHKFHPTRSTSTAVRRSTIS